MPLIEKRFRTAQEGFAYIESFTNLERTNTKSIRTYRLDRMRALLELFGNPHDSMRSIHIAGTKGKGSTGIYLASILAEAGLKTGFYASPHVSSYTERITEAGTPFEEALYVEMINSIVARLEALGRGTLPARANPTTFELLTLLGFLIFREVGCEWAIVETGIGGRLDATNVVSPEACVLTPVEREHVELLGATLPQIAGEKAGIIKAGVPVFSGYQPGEVRQVFEKTSALRNAPLSFLADALQSIDAHLHPSGSEVDFRWTNGERESFELSMPGEVQAENAALAVLTVRSLFGGEKASRLDIEAALRRGLRRARLPGRLEVFAGPREIAGVGRSGADIVLDAAHTPVSVTRLLDSFRRMYAGDGVLLFGSIRGKNPEGMAAALAPAFRHVFISTPGSFKKSDPAEVWRHFSARNPSTKLLPAPRQALAAAIEAAAAARLPVLVTGSFYMVAEIRAMLLAHGTPLQTSRSTRSP